METGERRENFEEDMDRFGTVGRSVAAVTDATGAAISGRHALAVSETLPAAVARAGRPVSGGQCQRRAGRFGGLYLRLAGSVEPGDLWQWRGRHLHLRRGGEPDQSNGNGCYVRTLRRKHGKHPA